MPPSKRSSTKTSAGTAPRANRGRSSAATSVAISDSVTLPASDATSSSSSGTVSIDVAALSATVSAVVTEALKTTLSSETLTGILKNTGPSILLEPLALESSSSVGAVLTAEVADILQDGHASGTNRGGAPAILNDSRPQSTFTTISVPLSSRVSAKLKAKIFANEYVDIGALLSSSPNNEGKYSLSMAPSEGSSSRPQITLEPLQNANRIQSIQQWVSAFNIFVSVYSEKFTVETPRLMKYCEVVRDLAQKAGDWIWYDEQFRYLRQTAPEKYPWDQIHWELWIRASSSFRKTQPLTNKQSQPNRSRSRSQFFPKGTCWAFQAGKHCTGCQFTHECFKCGAKHPGSQCSSPSAQNRPSFGSKGPRGGAQTQSPSQLAGNPGKRGTP